MDTLAGRTVLVTRPAAQSARLVQLLQSRGAQVLTLPLLRIEALADTTLPAKLDAAMRADGWIFTSVNAVMHTRALRAPPWPPCHAIGAATAAAIRTAGQAQVHTPPHGSTSEDLLSLDEFQQVQGRHFLLCSGVGGRDVMAPELRRRGATVERVDVYRRVPLHPDDRTLAQHVERSDALICTSGESLRHLDQLAPAATRAQLHGRVLVVPSARVLELARSLGFVAAHCAPAITDDAFVACLERAFARPAGTAHRPS